MEALLDANFIISCIKKKIDFISELEILGFNAVIPKEVMQEIKDIKKRVSHEDKMAIDVAQEIFSSKKTKKISLGGKKIDESLIDKGKQGIYIASLDSYIKRNVPNKIVISSSGKRLVIERS